MLCSQLLEEKMEEKPSAAKEAVVQVEDTPVELAVCTPLIML